MNKATVITALTLALVLSGAFVHAERTLVPEIPKGRGTECVEPTDVMRRDHMELMLHQRDETVHRGIRSSRHSLTGCIDCHAVRKADGQLARADDDEHFCSSCHRYAAVRIDCFECHADRPQNAQPTSISTINRALTPVSGLSP